MKKNTLYILLAVIAVLLILSTFVSFDSDSSLSDAQSTGQKILPELYDQLNTISRIGLINNKGNIIIEKKDASWVIKSKNNYPGNVTQIRSLLITLAELEKVEAKTKKPQNYSKLGVQAYNADKIVPGSQSTHIVLNSKSGNLASIIIGNSKSGHTPGPRGIKKLNYVRLAKDKQVWLVAGNLKLPALKNFMNTDIVNIAADRIKKVNIKHPKASRVTISKKSKTDKQFVLKQLTKNKELSSPGALNAIAAVLSNFTFDDVSKNNDNQKFKKPIKVEFVTFNGLTINMNVAKKDKKYYLWLDAKSSKPNTISLKQKDIENKNKVPDAKQQVTEINKKHRGWLYTIPSYQGETLTKQLIDLVKNKSKSKSK